MKRIQLLTDVLYFPAVFNQSEWKRLVPLIQSARWHSLSTSRSDLPVSQENLQVLLIIACLQAVHDNRGTWASDCGWFFFFYCNQVRYNVSWWFCAVFSVMLFWVKILSSATCVWFTFDFTLCWFLSSIVLYIWMNVISSVILRKIDVRLYTYKKQIVFNTLFTFLSRTNVF